MNGSGCPVQEDEIFDGDQFFAVSVDITCARSALWREPTNIGRAWVTNHPKFASATAVGHAAEAGQGTIPRERSRSQGRAVAADRHVGMRIRERRLMLGLSQQQLARLIGVTYQQAHKYERGLNRISAGRLFEIAQVLQVPISWFFEGLDEGAPTPGLTVGQRRVLELARNFSAISNERHQEALSEMARVLAAQAAADRSP